MENLFTSVQNFLKGVVHCEAEEKQKEEPIIFDELENPAFLE